ncbi:hypothetical protein EI983_12490 [Roseovarius faecimaris]|uniref:Uncharacterized protein n=1 Tax=Roseovarius faecimaris TaxID=2494550 RepID=A0A6I6IT26_9RHOB|nr:hypothetical protein [Roseovarius faecimaris]QGX99043.1 hypothetical protein EI983_12490 [Roseovarius faecimaris]
MRSIIFTSTLAMSLCAMATAQEGPTPGCYTREYSQAHLDAHPDQVARAVYLLIQDQTHYDTTDRYAYLVVDFAEQGHVKRAGLGAQRLDQSLVCWKDSNGIRGCSVDCDGGWFTVSGETDSAMTIATEYLMVGDTEGCGGAIDLAEQPGQTVKYRLNRVDQSACLALVEN